MAWCVGRLGLRFGVGGFGFHETKLEAGRVACVGGSAHWLQCVTRVAQNGHERVLDV
jgi:hypothetical protein